MAKKQVDEVGKVVSRVTTLCVCLYFFLTLFASDVTALTIAVTLSALIAFEAMPYRRVSLPRWLLVSALAGMNVYSYNILYPMLLQWLPELAAWLVSVHVIGGTFLLLPLPTGQTIYQQMLEVRRQNMTTLPRSSRP